MKKNENYQELMLNSAKLEVPRESYQRPFNPGRTRKIVAEFDERVANEPKVSYRNDHYYVFDGQHTIAARKLRNGGADGQDARPAGFDSILFDAERPVQIREKGRGLAGIQGQLVRENADGSLPAFSDFAYKSPKVLILTSFGDL